MVKLHHRHHHGQGYLHFAAAVLGLALLWDLASDLSLRLEEVVNVAVVACPLYCVISRVAAPMLAGTAERPRGGGRGRLAFRISSFFGLNVQVNILKETCLP